MMRRFQQILFAVFAVWALNAQVASAQNFPFPQHVTYTAGTIKPSLPQTVLDQTNRLFYDAWKAKYLVNGCDTNHYYIKYQNSGAITVSEAHGYGMMIFALMAGYDTYAQKYFDGMYRFFTNHQSSITPYLMGWQEDPGCVFANGGDDSATDGDMDIGYALILADRQWGSSGSINYLAEARKVIAALMKGDINTNAWSEKLGDWSDISDPNYYYGTRPSDFMMDHFRAYQIFSGNTNWSRVIDKCYSIIDTIQTNNSQATGLVPDFVVHVNTTPTPAPPKYLEDTTDKDYGYNSCRVPWRMATDYLVSGDPRAKTALDRINAWVQSKTSGNPANIKAGYNITNGTALVSYSDNAFTAPFTVGAMVNATNQVWLNKLWTNIVTFPINSGAYYDNTIKLIDLIVLSGNWWTPTLKPTIITNYSRLPDGTVSLQFIAEPQFTNHVQMSTDLVNWATLLTTNPVGTNFNFVDTQAPPHSQRFYRVR